ncbi:nicotinamide N-methyltransferase-like [Ambystoma mexicanum]|uniref:nicotinamide N-methyltransferase-like n=1 Tax=Ambystoma mexicanum TaxID=8296 RepID=UPI0037E8FDCE
MLSPAALKEMYDNCFVARKWVEMYYHTDSGFVNDSVMIQVQIFVDIFRSGKVKGDSLIAFTLGPTIHELLPVCEIFKEITVSVLTDDGCEELKKWVANDPGAIDWSSAVKMFCEHEGNGEKWMEKQEALRRAIKHILPSDLTKSNPFAPRCLQPVDCLYSVFSLGCLYLDKPAFLSALGNLSLLLKTEGYLLLVIVLDTTYFMVGKFKFPMLCTDEECVNEALCKTGYAIEKQVVIPRIQESLFDVTDFTSVMMVLARKVRNIQ